PDWATAKALTWASLSDVIRRSEESRAYATATEKPSSIRTKRLSGSVAPRLFSRGGIRPLGNGLVRTVLEEHRRGHVRHRNRGAPFRGTFAHAVENKLEAANVVQVRRHRRLRGCIIENVEVHPRRVI